MSDPAQQDPWNMSDDAFLEQGGADAFEDAFEEEAPGEDASESDEDVTAETGTEAEAEADDQDPENDGTDEEDDDAADEAEDGDGENAADETESDEEDDGEEEDDTEEKEELQDDVDYKAFFDAVTAEFKANGRQMKVSSPEDVIRLMQMGANYNRKMAALKPNMKVLKVLEKANLLDTEKLNYLIDLNEKRPEAIAKLLADSKVDPMDVDLEQAGDYKPSDRRVDDREIDLDEVVDDIKDTPTFNQTIDLVSNRWDEESKQAVASSPQLLRVLNDHMANGVYDLISTEIEQERMLGRLVGTSDIEAYQKVGDAIAERGGFDHLFKPQSQPAPKKPATPDPEKAAKEKKRRSKRRAASPSKPAAPQAQAEDFNPLGLSDAEFEKQFDERFL